ncbi:MAG TPA: hypothetical protein VHW72_01340 [Candidatus Angelobacter sp.]|jgi:hypothetical protein|nr:hypothetical protein [Candidatus Angelobacter sp.]
MTNDGVKALLLGSSQGNLQALALGTSTAEASFAINGNSAANPAIAASAAILKLPNAQPVTAIGTGFTPTFYWDNGRPFLIQGWGKCVTGVSANLTLKLYQVPASVVAAGLAAGSVVGCNLLATSTARAVNSTTGKFIIQAELQWDSTTGLIHGCFTDTINNLLDAYAATTAVTTATLADNELNFLLSATLSSGNAANIVTLAEFAPMTV